MVNADFDPICRLTESGPAPRHAGGALFASGALSGKRRESASGAPMPPGKGTAANPEQQTLSAQDALT